MTWVRIWHDDDDTLWYWSGDTDTSWPRSPWSRYCVHPSYLRCHNQSVSEEENGAGVVVANIWSPPSSLWSWSWYSWDTAPIITTHNQGLIHTTTCYIVHTINIILIQLWRQVHLINFANAFKGNMFPLQKLISNKDLAGTRFEQNKM